MKLVDLMRQLPETGLDDLPFPRNLLGAFRRKSITFCTGVTDETTLVYWFQSRSFTIDLRLPDGDATAIPARQGWIGDTIWDRDCKELSWAIAYSYQPGNQWPEPATFQFIGNCILEFAPSGAYVEDWRQQCSSGPILGLRLVAIRDNESGEEMTMDGGLIVAGRHMAYAQSRLPQVDAVLKAAASLDNALAEGLATEREIESYEVSVANDGHAITHSTRTDLLGTDIADGDFQLQDDGTVVMAKPVDGRACTLHFSLDLYVSNFAFDRQTPCTAQAREWIEDEESHLARHAVVAH
ncbi:hypothetical protein [Novosphingobium sp. KN65.2]|uniref:hypothetical protein n=1 Tax=Novosphingobium sp. KN65.2 TaxID=1478134 RepID=UPI0005DF3D17|nr:hypothetical protein [Novosphingobium sp. KN65.2]CDO35153.1 conserved hypothetical protein [Novosphingobium sp. KN65.2]